MCNILNFNLQEIHLKMNSMKLLISLAVMVLSVESTFVLTGTAAGLAGLLGLKALAIKSFAVGAALGAASRSRSSGRSYTRSYRKR